MVADFQKHDLETLVDKLDRLVYRILSNIKTDDDEESIDVDCLCDLLEDFCGRDYIVWTKLSNDMPLSKADREYLQDILNKRQ